MTCLCCIHKTRRAGMFEKQLQITIILIQFIVKALPSNAANRNTQHKLVPSTKYGMHPCASTRNP